MSQELFVPDVSGQYNPTPAATLAPFESLGTNVRTAVADVDGDGNEDTIFVTGPGVPIQFAVVSGADNSPLLVTPIAPFAGSEDFAGGGFVSAADFDGDGRSEIVITPDLGGGTRVTIFSINPDGAFVMRANFFGIDDPDFRGRARTGTGDVDGDGTPDLAVSAGSQGGPRIALFDGTTLTTTRDKLLNDFFAFEDSLRNGAYLAIGDLNADGFGDLLFGAGPGGAPRLLAVSGQQLLSSARSRPSPLRSPTSSWRGISTTAGACAWPRRTPTATTEPMSWLAAVKDPRPAYASTLEPASREPASRTRSRTSFRSAVRF